MFDFVRLPNPMNTNRSIEFDGIFVRFCSMRYPRHSITTDAQMHVHIRMELFTKLLAYLVFIIIYYVFFFFNFKEWLLGTSCVQPEEKERIMKFVFKKDAKSALASIHTSLGIKCFKYH